MLMTKAFYSMLKKGGFRGVFPLPNPKGSAVSFMHFLNAFEVLHSLRSPSSFYNARRKSNCKHLIMISLLL